MVLGESEPVAAGRRRRPDRQPLLLGQLDGGVPAAGGVDVRSGDQRRILGVAQPRRQLGDLCVVGPCAPADRAPGLVHEVGRLDLDRPVVHRDRDERGAGRRQLRIVNRARDRVGHVGRPQRLVAPLHVGLGNLDRVAIGEVGLQPDELARLLAGRHQQRRLVGLRVEDRADAVADAGGRVKVDVRDVAAGLRVTVGHADRDRLLQAEHVAEVGRERAQHRQLGRSRVAEDRRHPALAEEVEGRVADGRHGCCRLPRAHCNCWGFGRAIR